MRSCLRWQEHRNRAPLRDGRGAAVVLLPLLAILLYNFQATPLPEYVPQQRKLVPWLQASLGRSSESMEGSMGGGKEDSSRRGHQRIFDLYYHALYLFYQRACSTPRTHIPFRPMHIQAPSLVLPTAADPSHPTPKTTTPRLSLPQWHRHLLIQWLLGRNSEQVID